MGPLAGIRIIEMAGLGPGPYCGMLLADFGADIIRIDRPVPAMNMITDTRGDILGRGKRSMQLDLRKAEDQDVLWKLIDTSDAIFEGMRPGVMERLGFGPDVALKRKPKLVYGRMTGFGQTGPLADDAGHDINYLAISGSLGHLGTAEQPLIPLNFLADFGGGAMFLAFGMLSALLNVARGGPGQIVDATMVDGVASLAAMFHGLRHTKRWKSERAANFLDGGAHFYNTYATKDGLWVSVGAIEPQFYQDLLKGLGIDTKAQPDWNDYFNADKWPGFKTEIAKRFKEKTRDEWTAIFKPLDACYAPILTWDDAGQHPHNIERKVFVDVDGVTQPAPAPRLSATPGALTRPPPSVGEHTAELLKELGLPARS